MPRLAVITLAVFAATASAAAEPVRFNRDVRPILSDKCFRCHGPDAAAVQGDLRLDLRDSALKEHDGHAAVVPGKPQASELVTRIATTNADERMPPADSELVLTDAERDVLQRWIVEGAEYEPHWAFVPPKKAAPPTVKNDAWIRNPIDAFVLARLEQEKWSPSPEADAETLCRRLYLDLTGIPPTPQEVHDFVQSIKPRPLVAKPDRDQRSRLYGYSGNGLPCVSGANGSAAMPSRKISDMNTPA